jgi:putative ABC transport system permease protein
MHKTAVFCQNKVMVKPRWRKVIKDLLGNRTRTILVVLAIAVGVFAVGMISGTQSIIDREMRRNYYAANSASAIVYTDPFDEPLVRSIERLPDVSAAEGRSRIRVHAEAAPDEWRELLVAGIGDFDDIRVDIIRPSGGQWSPGKEEIVIERNSMAYLKAEPGDMLLVELDDGRFRSLTIIGLAHDVDVPDAQFADIAFGYVSMETLAWLGGNAQFTQLHFTVSENREDEAVIRVVGDIVTRKIERSGRSVYWTSVPTPGEHWAEEIVSTLLLLLSVFGFLTLFLSGFLVVNTIAAILTQHVKQIGIMKIVGARRRQIVFMYLVMVVVYGVLSLGVAVPLGAAAAQAFVTFIAGIINIEVSSFVIPTNVLLLELCIGLAVPLLAALWPVIMGVQITIQKALTSLNLGQGQFGRGWADRLFVRVQRRLPMERPLLISLRNTIRRKGRLALTLLTLILGSAIFISVLSVQASLYRTVDDFLQYRQYDVRLSLDGFYRLPRLLPLVQNTPGVVNVEGWGTNEARRLRSDGSSSDGVELVAPPATTKLINPTLMEGRWLRPDDTDAIVVNSDFIDAEPDVQVGSTILLDVDGRESEWQVVGIVQGVIAGAIVYVNYDTYAWLTRNVGQASRLYVVTSQHDAAFQTEMAQKLTDVLTDANIGVSSARTIASFKETMDFQFGILITFLLIMAVLLAVVGGLGLMATMSINVLERTREIGVMRAIGASDTAVRRIILVEGVLIGLLSWFLGSLLAIPLSKVLSAQVGIAFTDAPLSHAFSLFGVLLWLLIVSGLSALASYMPARSASRLTVREVLAYE